MQAITNKIHTQKFCEDISLLLFNSECLKTTAIHNWKLRWSLYASETTFWRSMTEVTSYCVHLLAFFFKWVGFACIKIITLEVVTSTPWIEKCPENDILQYINNPDSHSLWLSSKMKNYSHRKVFFLCTGEKVNVWRRKTLK